MKSDKQNFTRKLQTFNLKYSDLLFWIFPVILTFPGFFHPESPKVYFESLFFTFLFLETWFIGGGAIIWFIAQFLGDKLQQYKKFNPLVEKEIFGTTITAYTISAIAAWPVAQRRLGHEIVFSWNLNQSFSMTLIQFSLLLVGSDAFTYWKHWFLHRPFMFPFHKFHHAFHDPSSFSSFSFHPVDAFFTFSPIYLAMINQIQLSAQMYVFYIVFFVMLNLYMHCGYSVRVLDLVLSKALISSSVSHNAHHEKSHCNFGEVSWLWDYLNSTMDQKNKN
jgi:sterol desaturase/sphingolipid hydroxylase (fatty acid hydroxylase superfamily)